MKRLLVATQSVDETMHPTVTLDAKAAVPVDAFAQVQAKAFMKSQVGRSLQTRLDPPNAHHAPEDSQTLADRQ